MSIEVIVEKNRPFTSERIDFPGGFTVLMAVYGRDDASLLARAVESIFQNTLSPQEIVLVVDGPLTFELERTLEVLVEQAPLPFRLLRLPYNKGLAAALNAGLPTIRTPWVVRADADDINLPHRFETLAAMIHRDPSLQLVGSAVLEVDAAGAHIAVRELPEDPDRIKCFARRRSPFNHPSVAFLRDVVIEVGGYPQIYLKEDYALWINLLLQGISTANTKEVLVHMSAGSLYKRRGGLRYARAEWSMQSMLVRMGMKSLRVASLDYVVRTTIALAPPALRAIIYRRALRRSSMRN